MEASPIAGEAVHSAVDRAENQKIWFQKMKILKFKKSRAKIFQNRAAKIVGR